MNALPFAEFKIKATVKIAEQDPDYTQQQIAEIQEKVAVELKRYLWREHRLRTDERGVRVKNTGSGRR